jgi:cardiolipin synthase
MELHRPPASEKIVAVIFAGPLSSAGRIAVVIPAVAAAEARGVQASIFFGMTTGEGGGQDAASLTADAASSGVKIRPVREPRLHAKLLAWDDDSAVITSQNWLSADPSEGNMRREIGVFIEAPGIARRIIDQFHAIRATN